MGGMALGGWPDLLLAVSYVRDRGFLILISNDFAISDFLNFLFEIELWY